MPLYLDANDPRDPIHRAPVAGSVQPVQDAVGSSGSEHIRELSSADALQAFHDFFAGFDRRIANQRVWDLMHTSDGASRQAKPKAETRGENSGEEVTR